MRQSDLVPCKACGKQVSKTAKVCPYCDNQIAEKRKKQNDLITSIFMIIMLAIILLLFNLGIIDIKEIMNSLFSK